MDKLVKLPVDPKDLAAVAGFIAAVAVAVIVVRYVPVIGKHV